jgi:hypothetical protein
MRKHGLDAGRLAHLSFEHPGTISCTVSLTTSSSSTTAQADATGGDPVEGIGSEAKITGQIRASSAFFPIASPLRFHIVRELA